MSSRNTMIVLGGVMAVWALMLPVNAEVFEVGVVPFIAGSLMIAAAWALFRFDDAGEARQCDRLVTWAAVLGLGFAAVLCPVLGWTGALVPLGVRRLGKLRGWISLALVAVAVGRAWTMPSVVGGISDLGELGAEKVVEALASVATVTWSALLPWATPYAAVGSALGVTSGILLLGLAGFLVAHLLVVGRWTTPRRWAFVAAIGAWQVFMAGLLGRVLAAIKNRGILAVSAADRRWAE